MIPEASEAFGSAGIDRRFLCAQEAHMDTVIRSTSKPDVYQAITEKIIAAMEAGAH